MALINCPRCGKQISDKANKCPHCGFLSTLSSGQDERKNPQTSISFHDAKSDRNKWLKHPFILYCIIPSIIIVVGYLAYSSFKEPCSKMVARSQPDYTLSAIELNSQYYDNQFAAKQKYEGKILRVQGKIAMFQSYFTEVDLSTGLLSYLTCYCAKDQANVLSKLSIGQEITVKGIFSDTGSLDCCVIE